MVKLWKNKRMKVWKNARMKEWKNYGKNESIMGLKDERMKEWKDVEGRKEGCEFRVYGTAHISKFGM